MTIAVIDLETTGLDPERHHVWEIGLIIHNHHKHAYLNGEWLWQIKPDLSTAEPIALQKNGFYRRELLWRRKPTDAVTVQCPPGIEDDEDEHFRPRGTSRSAIGRWLAQLLVDATLYAAIPDFDVPFLGNFVRTAGQCPMWRHRVRCVESLTAGYLRHDVGGLRDCADALEIAYDPDDLHTALGDARLADQIRQRVMKPVTAHA